MIASLEKKFSSLRAFHKADLQKVTFAASLAYHGCIKTIRNLDLRHIDLTSIPADHPATLVSCVTCEVTIMNTVTGFDLVRFIDSLRCEWLYIGVIMGTEETQALVRAMESHLVNVRIRGSWKMTLDIAELTKYSGQGKCSHIQCYGYVYNNVFKEELGTRAQIKNWKTELINNGPVMPHTSHIDNYLNILYHNGPLYFTRVVKP